MNKKKVVYAVLVAAVIVILAVSNVWFFMGNENLKNQVNTLETEKSNLQSQVSNLEMDKSQLQSQVSSLETEKSGLLTQVDSLNSQINSLNSQITNLQNDVAYGESEMARLNDIIENLKSEAAVRDNEMYLRDREIDSLEAQISSLNYQIDDLNNQIDYLDNQIDDLRAAKLVNIGVGAYDNREYAPYSLHVYGWVCNVGRYFAYNSRLHVVAYYINGTLAIDTYVDIGPVAGTYAREINAWINYEGPNLDMTRLTMTPEWTDTY